MLVSDLKAGTYGGIKLNNFKADLKWSETMVDKPWWENVYRQAWPEFGNMVAVREDGWAQRAGIDRIVTLTTGKVIKIDEKVRRKDYGDILLEHMSSKEHGTPGWVNKPLDADYIAYAIEPTEKCYLLPVHELQRAWRKYEDTWRWDYGDVEALNPGYTTVSTPVPSQVLQKALTYVMVFSWNTKPQTAQRPLHQGH